MIIRTTHLSPCKVWPEFAAKSNDLSPSKEKMTIADAISHRGGLVDLGPSGIWACVCSIWAWYRTGSWRAAWDPMVRRIEILEPEWTPGTHAAYHPVSYSWIVGGIVEGASRQASGATMHISDLVKSVAARIGEAHNMYIGIVPPHEDSRIAAMETPRASAYLNFGRTQGAADDAMASAPGSLRRWLELFILAPIEAGLLKLVCNLPLFRRICLPSSNGVVTAQAVAKMYCEFDTTTTSVPTNLRNIPFHTSITTASACLANKGISPEGQEVISNGTIEKYRARMSEGTDGRMTSQHPDGEIGFTSTTPLRLLRPAITSSSINANASTTGAYPHIPARLSLGYFPWYEAELHGEVSRANVNVTPTPPEPHQPIPAYHETIPQHQPRLQKVPSTTRVW